ncbi:AAA domain-containing protein [[Mycoplasma] testudinis]|uniref:AAA domain-containing protein n=1 Tax=[Mycoplasma] testudinis TaxID=33924 RepID=UPI0004849DD4|nr:AAA domain-containing protein [[Mycoplasma] testudinis]
MAIKLALNPGFKLSFFAKLFKTKLEVTSQETNFINYFNNYYSSFDTKCIKYVCDIFAHSTDVEYQIALYFIRNNYESLDQLINLLLSAQYVNFGSDDKFEKVLNLFNEQYKPEHHYTIDKISVLSTSERNLINVYLANNLTKKQIIDFVNYYSIDEAIISQTLQILDYLKNEEENYDAILKSINNKFTSSASLSFAKLKSHIKKTFKNANSDLLKEYNYLKNQANLKRRKSIKVMFDQAFNALNVLFPMVLATPEVVSTLFKIDVEPFDYIVFDEASQMFVERAIPALNRASRAIVAGDSKQLRPSSFFESHYAESETSDEDERSLEEISALETVSLLDIAKNKYKTKMLKFHYRSYFKELIEFSSAAFYNNELYFASKVIAHGKPIEEIKVDTGLWTNNGTNVEEAKKVVELVTQLMQTRNNNETIGIITFNIKQKELIENMLEDASNTAIIKEMNRTNPKDGSDESLFVKNIENVQGDERDIVIFSVGYAKNEDGKLFMRFGPINQAGGENRLNVAITRAKKKIYVVKSFDSNELKVSEDNPGPMRFKQYLHFIELVSANKTLEKQALLDSLHNSTDVYGNNLKKFDSVFEKEVYAAIETILPDNLIIKNQVQVGSFFIDLAIYDKNNDQFILGIECDGLTYHSKTEDVQRDFFRQQYLESCGWKIYRILSTNWFLNREYEMQKINLKIHKLVDLVSNMNNSPVVNQQNQ